MEEHIESQKEAKEIVTFQKKKNLINAKQPVSLK
jgi:hypothetical protein